MASLTLLLLLIVGCAPLIAEYNLEAYKNATTLKAEVDDVMKLGTEPYQKHAEKVRAIGVKIDAAYEFAAGVPNNQTSAAQWRLMRDRDGGLFGGFVTYWRQNARLSRFVVDADRKTVSRAFDLIICLEANKQKSTSCVGATPGATERNQAPDAAAKGGKNGQPA
jgi:hypothetical protein